MRVTDAYAELRDRDAGARAARAGTRPRAAAARSEPAGARAGDEDELHGVVPELAVAVREDLDSAGHERVRIVVSGGFDAAKIARFEAAGAPVDSHGVGSALLRGEFDFTADVVELDGRPAAKFGRQLRPNPRLRPVA